VQWVDIRLNPAVVPSVPLPPSISAIVRGATSATILFSPAADGGAPIRVLGLTRQVAYSCTLVAQNSVGSSAASATHAVAARPTNLLPLLLLLD
jgi:hypothetical protein